MFYCCFTVMPLPAEGAIELSNNFTEFDGNWNINIIVGYNDINVIKMNIWVCAK